jgi:hypothetical protein
VRMVQGISCDLERKELYSLISCCYGVSRKLCASIGEKNKNHEHNLYLLLNLVVTTLQLLSESHCLPGTMLSCLMVVLLRLLFSKFQEPNLSFGNFVVPLTSARHFSLSLFSR